MDKSIRSYSVLRNLFGIILFVFATQNNVNAQVNASAKLASIKLLDTYLNTTKDSDQIRLKDLVYEVQSSVYFQNNEAKTYGSAPVSLYTDFIGFNQLSQANFQKATIELITIRIDTPSAITRTINLSSLTGFTNLKYIYILTTFPCTLDQISKVVSLSGSNYIVVYKSEIGS